MSLNPYAEETKSENLSKNRLGKNLDFSKIYQPEVTKSPQDSSGEEAKHDSRDNHREILVDCSNKNDSALDINDENEIREELVS